MSRSEEQLVEANWVRMREAITRHAVQIRRMADELEAISFDSSKGVRRSPDAIISQAAMVALGGSDNATLIHRLATWAETISEIQQHKAESTSCNYTSDDPIYRRCILEPDHSLPIIAGGTEHVAADGSVFL